MPFHQISTVTFRQTFWCNSSDIGHRYWFHSAWTIRHYGRHTWQRSILGIVSENFFYILCTKAKRSTKLHKFRFYSHAGQCRSFGVVAFSRCLTSIPLVGGKTKGEDMWWATFLLIMLLMEGEAVWLDWGEKL